MFYSISDALQAWNHLSENVLGSTNNKREEITVQIDHSFITPTIIALGEFPEANAKEILEITQEEPTVIWNLGCRQLSSQFRATFKNQIIDSTWRSPCKYTRAPVLDCIFSLCQSIKSWYDLNDKNLAIIHCPRGQPSTGILIACLLKYIGAFEHAAEAFDFYCSKRLQKESTHSLAPSYRILFENVDKAVNNGGYLNTGPLHLKTLTIAALPVDEIPCIEVWDLSGIVFASHNGNKPTSMCTWNEEFGDGYFRVSQNLIGDFSIVCRFGGDRSMDKDKSTLIFKYQNSTAFLPNEVVELKHFNCDINPRYLESIDINYFTVHLMFGAPEQTTNQHDVTGKQMKLLPIYHSPGLDAFEAGLDEISKKHPVLPDPSKSDHLIERGMEDRYATVGLQLANNDVEYASKLVSMMKDHAIELCRMENEIMLQNLGRYRLEGDEMSDIISNDMVSVGSNSTIDPSKVNEDDDSNHETVDDMNRCQVCHDDHKEDQLIYCTACHRAYHTHCVGKHAIPYRKSDKEKQLIREKYIKTSFGDWKCPDCTVQPIKGSETATNKGTPKSILFAKKNRQAGNALLRNRKTKKVSKSLTNDSTTHDLTTKTLKKAEGEVTSNGTPHTMSTPASRQSYGVTMGGGGVIVTDQVHGHTNQTGNPFPAPMFTNASPTKTIDVKSPGLSGQLPKGFPNSTVKSTPIKTKHDNIATLMGMLDSHNIPIKSLAGMSQQRQIDTVLAVINHQYDAEYAKKLEEKEAAEKASNVPIANQQLDLASAMKGIISQPQPDPVASLNSTFVQTNPMMAQQQMQGTMGNINQSMLLNENILRGGVISHTNAPTSTGTVPLLGENVLRGGIINNPLTQLLNKSNLPNNGTNKENSQNVFNSPNFATNPPTNPFLPFPHPKEPIANNPYDFLASKKSGLDNLTVNTGMGDQMMNPFANTPGNGFTPGSMPYFGLPGGGYSPFGMMQNPFQNNSSVSNPEMFNAKNSPFFHSGLLNSKQFLLDASNPPSGSNTPTRVGQANKNNSVAKQSMLDSINKKNKKPQLSNYPSGNSGSGVGFGINNPLNNFPSMMSGPPFPQTGATGLPTDFGGQKWIGNGGIADQATVGSNPGLRGSMFGGVPGAPPGVGNTGFPGSTYPTAGNGVQGATEGGTGVPGSESTSYGNGIFHGYDSNGNPMFLNGTNITNPQSMLAGAPANGMYSGMGFVGNGMMGMGYMQNGVFVSSPYNPNGPMNFNGMMMGNGVMTPNMMGNFNPAFGGPFNSMMGFGPGGTNAGPDTAMNATVKGPKIKDVPEYNKFFKMIKVGIPKSIVVEKLMAEGLVASVEEGMNIISADPNKPIPDELLEKLSRKPASLLKSSSGDHTIGNESKTDQSEPKEEESNSNQPEKVKISEHPKYERFYKMLKVGLPAVAVKAKMTQEGLHPSMIDKSPDELILLKDEEEVKKEMVPMSEHPKYSKFFKMLKVGLPMVAVKAKMTQEGVDPNMIEKDPNEQIPLHDEVKEEGKKVPIAEHPKYEKFFKMLKVGLPAPVVKIKMQQEGVDPTYLDKDPTELILLDETASDSNAKEEMIRVDEHPKFLKYFKMIKMGLPLEGVQNKMRLEGLDPNILNMDPSTMVPVDETKIAKMSAAATNGLKKVEKGPKVRKKKLYWKAIDESKLGRDSLWANSNDEEIMLDEEEFNKLFVESVHDNTPNKTENTAVVKKVEVNKKIKVNLIDMKRAQNAGIALARIKIPFTELKQKIMNMDDENLTTDQLRSIEVPYSIYTTTTPSQQYLMDDKMQEYLPTPEEMSKLKVYRGDVEMLGQAEKFMLVMADCTNAAPDRIKCMIYKQQFKNRVMECRSKVSKVENACDDVKLSNRLKKVLKTILRVGNQLNDGEEHKGFALDSLLKLQSAKAFDKKTSILQYVIMLIYRNDPDILLFPEDLKHVEEASRIVIESVGVEKSELKKEFDDNFTIVMGIQENDPDNQAGSMIDFLSKASTLCEDLEKRYANVKTKYTNVLAYFGEEPSLPSNEFFSTLTKFIKEFIVTRDNVERLRRQEMKKQTSQTAAPSVSTNKIRRHSTVTGSTDSSENHVGSHHNMKKLIINKVAMHHHHGHHVNEHHSGGEDGHGHGHHHLEQITTKKPSFISNINSHSPFHEEDGRKLIRHSSKRMDDLLLDDHHPPVVTSTTSAAAMQSSQESKSINESSNPMAAIAAAIAAGVGLKSGKTRRSSVH